LRRPRYMRYMAREVTCIFIGAYTLLLIVALKRLSEGQAAWEAFMEALKGPGSIAFHVLALAFALYHTTTWFNVAPKALPVQIGVDILPGGVVAGAHYAVWVVLSLGVIFLAGVF